MTADFDRDEQTRRAWTDAAAAFANEWIEATDTPPPHREASELINPPIGEAPLPGGIDAAIEIIRKGAEASLNPTGTGYFGFIPGGGLYASAIADFISDVINRYTGLNEPAEPLVRLEKTLLQWLAEQFGYAPGTAGGMFTSGSSLANFAAVVGARDATGHGGDLRALTGYASTQVHHSVHEAFRLAGVPHGNVAAIDVDDRLRMRVGDLRRRVRDDRAKGKRPFIVIASAGTTNTGAIDPLAEIAALCAEEGLWFHVDGAYGGAFMLCEEARARFKGIALADSIAFDPHKGLFLPYGTGCLLFKGARAEAAGSHANRAYLQNFTNIAPQPFSLELTRPFRGLRVWLPLMLHGADAFRSALREKLALAERLHAGLVDLAARGSALEVLAAPQLTVVAFRLARRAGEHVDAWNRRNEAFHQAVNAGQTFVSSTVLPEHGEHVLTLRACVLSHRSHAEHIERAIKDIARAASVQ